MSNFETQFSVANPGDSPVRYFGTINPPPLALLRFPFTFASPGLTTGRSLVTLPIGAVIYDIGVQIPIAFDGTTPLADVGAFSGNTGLFDQLAGGAVQLDNADAAVTDNAGLSAAIGSSWLQAAIGSVGAAAGAAFTPGALYVTAITQLSLVVSQSGQKGGTATGATAGVGVVYVLAATPYLA